MSAPEPSDLPPLDDLSLAYLERLYAEYLRDPHGVSGELRDHLERLRSLDPAADRFRLGPSFRPAGFFSGQGAAPPPEREAAGAALQGGIL